MAQRTGHARGRRRLRRVRAGIVALIAAGAAVAACDEGRGPQTLDYLGPTTEVVPASAAYAVLVGPPAFEFSYDTPADNSWLIFLDKEFRPVGNLHRKGMYQAQIARFGDRGVAFADRESITTVTKDRATTTPVRTTGMVADTASARSPQGDALIWLDIGLQKDAPGYRSTVARISSTGDVRTADVAGRLASTGWCAGSWYAAVATTDTGYQIADLSTDQLRHGPQWNGTKYQHGRSVPWTCADARATVFLSDRLYDIPNRGTELREVDTRTLATTPAGFTDIGPTKESFRAALSPWESIKASSDSWWGNETDRWFLTRAGDIIELQDNGHNARKVDTLDQPGDDVTLTAADTTSAGRAVAWSENVTGNTIHPDGAQFIVFDPADPRNAKATKAPEWIQKLRQAQPQIMVQDVAVL